MSSPRAVIVLVAPCLSVAPSLLRAAAPLSSEREAQVRALVDEAQAHRAAGRFDEAIATLQRAVALHPAPWLRYNLGRLHEVVARLDLARRHFELAAASEDDGETRKRALEGMGRIDALGPRGVLRLRIEADGDGTELRVDGHLWEAALGRELNLTRGPHLVAVTRAGLAPWRQTIEVGELTEVAVEVPRPGPREAAPPPEAPATAPATAPAAEPVTEAVTVASRPEPEGAGWLPWALSGLGLAGVATGAVFLAGWQADWRRVRESPDDAMLRDEAAALVASGAGKRDLGLTFGALGGAALLGGLVWALVGEERAETPSVTLHPSRGVWVSGRF